MIVRQIRLKNIKSFGEGDDGNGVIIRFDRGLNRIGGKNGTGKSSILEALGYALFDAEPIRGDNRVQVGTYLVREGNRTGEIDVWFETVDGIYRIERDAGRMERRWKVLREEDGYTEAEGNDEVKQLLAQLLGVSGPERLSELFHSLIGVKQGRFTAYFDCKASEAKAHFDPILDVDIFRTCFENLLEPLKLLQKQQVDLNSIINRYQGGMDQLKDAPEQRAIGENLLLKTRNDLQSALAAVEEYRLKLAAHEAARQRQVTAEQRAIEAQGRLLHARTIHINADKERAESEHAAQIVVAVLPGFETYQTAEKEYKLAEAQRLQRDQLLKDEGALQVRVERFCAEKIQRQEVIDTIQRDIETKQSEGSNRKTEVQNRNIAYQALTVEVDELGKRYQSVDTLLDTLKEWRISLQEQQNRFETELATLIRYTAEAAELNPEAVDQAKQDYELAVKEETNAKVLLARAEQEEEQLRQQLESIRDGVCPLLGEPCHQFSPDRIQDQLRALSVKITHLKTQADEAQIYVNRVRLVMEAAQAEQTRVDQIRHAMRLGENVLLQCCQSLENRNARRVVDELDAIWPGSALPEIRLPEAADGGIVYWQGLRAEIVHLVKALQANFDLWNREYLKLGQIYQAGLTRKEQEKAWLDQETLSLKKLGAEIIELQSRMDLEAKRMMAIELSLVELNQQLQKCHTALEDYPELDRKFQLLQQQMEQNAELYKSYLQNYQVAERLAERQARLAEAKVTVDSAERELEATNRAWEESRQAFDEAGYAHDQEQHQQAVDRLGQVRAEVEQVENELKRQRERIAQWEDLKAKCRQAYEQLDRLNAQSILLEKARHVLKNAQGLVASGLASRIGARAQAIYNSMSPEPAQFEWDSADYKLTVRNASGERRFTQLSGGQQMKAAIAMQLALVKEFSKAGICAFDEPTYGLDVESRSMLAEAIAAVYRECHFDQLLVVSHDETFDNRVEHLVDLKYSPVRGTMVEGEG